MPKSLSERIKWLMYHKNISRNQLMQDLNISKSTINAWIGGRVNELTIDKYVELSRAYNVPVEWIAGDEEQDPFDFLDKPSQNKPVYLTTEDPVQAMVDFKTLEGRFKWIIYHRHVYTSEIAKAAGVSPPTALSWILGKNTNVKIEAQRALSLKYNLPSDFFSNTEDKAVPDKENQVPQNNNSTPTMFPACQASITPEGSLTFYSDQALSSAPWIAIQAPQVLQNRDTEKSIRCIRVLDDTMAPRICRDDLVLVDLQDCEVSSGQTYLVSVQNQPPVIRRLVFNARKDIILIADNEPAAQTYIKNTEAMLELKVMGKIFFRAGYFSLS